MLTLYVSFYDAEYARKKGGLVPKLEAVFFGLNWPDLGPLANN
jgi:hypothetical protein